MTDVTPSPDLRRTARRLLVASLLALGLFSGLLLPRPDVHAGGGPQPRTFRVQVPGLEAFPFVINAGRVPAGRTFVIHTLYLVDTEVRQIELRVIGGGSGRPDPILVSSERPTNFTSGIAIAGGETLVLRRQDSDLSFVATVYIAGVLE